MHGLPPFALLEEVFRLSRFDDWPNATGLNHLKASLKVKMKAEFVCQSDLLAQGMYYEEIIYKQNIIPTRPGNWHDLFNGLIWLLFPKTKSLLNQWHFEDISDFGLSPRTPRRNRITHFDECGIILATTSELIPDLLKEHRWPEVFVKHRESWSESVVPFVFGHANLEMLLTPFIGLTGKWISVGVDTDFVSLSLAEQFTSLDEALYRQLIEQNSFEQKKALYPLPILGLPGWWDANRHPDFYKNKEYFRPQRR